MFYWASFEQALIQIKNTSSLQSAAKSIQKFYGYPQALKLNGQLKFRGSMAGIVFHLFGGQSFLQDLGEVEGNSQMKNWRRKGNKWSRVWDAYGKRPYVLINKMSKKRNGFINLLFDDPNCPEARQEQELKEVEMKKIERLMEENVFMPRNRLKYTRILRMDDSISIAEQKQSISKQIKKMFVDGSQLKEVLPRRQLVSQIYSRTIECQRLYSPDVQGKRRAQRQPQPQERSLDCARNMDFTLVLSDMNPQQTIGSVYKPNEQDKFISIASTERKDEFLSIDESTVCSSQKNIKRGISVRYRKVIPSDKRPKKEAKTALQLKKQLAKFYSNPFGNPENISAKAFIVVEHFRQKNNQRSLHAAMNSKINLQIASLTKIMTCILVIELCEKYKVNVKTSEVCIGAFQTKIEGTIAQLEVGQVYTVEQLLYGMMLPSGNDASIALSIFCGELIQANKEEAKKIEVDSELNYRKQFYKKFLLEMNKKCLELDMKRTFFSNSHGLPNHLNKSCASDVAILIDYALQNRLFRTIVQTTVYECDIKEPITKKGHEEDSAVGTYRKKRVKWENTHRLVQAKPYIYKGIKTGITQAAGPCLASLLEINSREFIIVVLNSRSLKARYKDTEGLREWLWRKEDFPGDINK